MEVRAFRLNQNDRFDMYLSVMNAQFLTSRIRVNTWRPNNSQGYQRELDDSRFEWSQKSLLKYMIKGLGIFPNSIIVNVREPLKFNEESALLDNCLYGTLDIGESEFWLIDGQHRLNIVKELFGTNVSYYTYPFIVTILNTPDPYIELLNFYFIHNRQQTITTNIKDKLLSTMMSLKGFDEIRELEGEYSYKRSYAFEIVNRLNADPDSVFVGRIGYSINDNKEQVIIEHHKMINSLMPLMNNIVFHGLALQEIADNLKKYWDGIYQVYPEIFEAPHEYVILTEKGVTLFHKLYISVYGDISKGGEVSTSKVEELFERLFNETPDHSVEEFKERLNDTFWHKKYGPDLIRKMSARDINKMLECLLEKLYVDNKEKIFLKTR
ncbi:MAG: DGQHR domain-containing protein [Candidatus Bathyarchaeota archaeon]